MKIKKLWLVTIAALWCSLTVSAYDFYVDGFYYNITSSTDLTVEVTRKSSNGYSGAITIPSEVTYNSKTYCVTSIGNDAFYGCSSLTSITIPEGVTIIGSYAFRGCSSLTSITIPENSKLTSIGSYAFQYCSLTSITLPEGVTSIGRYAFDGCSSLTAVHISSLEAWCNIEFEDSHANPLYYAKNLYLKGNLVTKLVIPNTVTSIGNYAFYNCSSLTSITIPENVTSIGRYAFDGCSSLTSIVVEEGNTIYDSRDGCNAIIETASNVLIHGCSATIIPASVTSISYNAFSDCSSLTSITIPEGVTSIGTYAFYNCSSLTSIAIPASVTSISQSAFGDCSSLTSITIPEGVTSIGDYAFYGCSSLTSITIPESVMSIGVDAFSGSPWYNNQPDGVVYIGKLLYNYKGTMPANTAIEVKEGTVSISPYAFEDCSSLTSIILPESVASIGRYAFDGCSSLTSIILPESVASIGSRAFEDCSSLKTVINYSDLTLQRGSSSDGYVAYYADRVINIDEVIDGYAFKTKYGVHYLTGYIGDNTELTLLTDYQGENYQIGERAFYDCNSLTSITIPENAKLTSIGSYAFSDCGSLTSITIPEGVTIIGSYAFRGCSSLTSITIPENSKLTSIGSYAFQYCSLTSIILPESVTSIGDDAFWGCSRLKTVINYSKLNIQKGSTNYGYVAYYADEVIVPEVLLTGKNYRVKNVTTGLYLQVSGNNTNMKLQNKAEGVELMQVFQLEEASEGMHYLKAADSDNHYYAHASGWNFNATTNAGNKTPFTIALVKGETEVYTLHQSVSEHTGLAGADDAAAGASIYCNKTADQNGKWSFEALTEEENAAYVTMLTATSKAALDAAIARGEEVVATRSAVLTAEEVAAISGAVQAAKRGKETATEESALMALADAIHTAVDAAIYVWSIDELSSEVCYAVSTEDRGAWYGEADRLNSTGKLEVVANASDAKQQFAFVKSATTGYYYLYTVSEKKFVKAEGQYTALTEAPKQTIAFLNGTRSAAFPWVVALNAEDGEKQIAVSNSYTPGIITFYNNLSDGGNTVRIEKVATFDASAALDAIAAFENPVIAVSGITLDQTAATLTEGETLTLTATVTPDNATDKTVTWSTSDATVATVDANGKVTAVAAGTATITATAGDKTAVCVVTVTKKEDDNENEDKDENEDGDKEDEDAGIDSSTLNTQHSTEIYDLSGRRVLNTENLKGGVYIIDGQKVVVK